MTQLERTGAAGPSLPESPEPTVAEHRETGVFRKEGEYWTIAHGGTLSRLKDIKGLVYISWLLQHPGQDIHVLDLVSRASRTDDTEPGTIAPGGSLPGRREELEGIGIHVGDLGDAGEVLDGQARSDYRRRLNELRDEFQEAKDFNHVERAAEIEGEIDALTRELSRALGLGGRRRRAGSAAERARQSVTRAIKTAIERIGENHPALQMSFSRAIRTGTYCCYQPEAGAAISWELGAAPAPGGGAQEARASAEVPQKIARPDLAVIGPPVAQFPSCECGFVGREAESLELCNLVDRASDGRGAIVMVGGGPGLGKTRLATKTAAYAESKGFRCLIGHCYERDDPYPYLPFAEIFESLLAQLGKDEFRDLLGDNAAELAQIAPQLRRIFPQIPAPAELPPQQARRYLFQSLAEYLARIANLAPLFLIVDDLQWADEATLALVNFLARRITSMPLVIVATYRDGTADIPPVLARTFEELIRIGIRPLKLRGLDQNAVARMLRGLSSREPPESLVQLIFKETDGNPFFVQEVFKHLVEEGKVFDEAGQFRADFHIGEVDVPASVRLVLGRRLGRLRPETRRILTAAAVIGGKFPFRLLESLAGANDSDELLNEIEEAQRMGVIVAGSDEEDAAFTFSHELVRQTLLAAISQPRRQRLHLDTANAIEALYSHETGIRAAEMAYHLTYAGSLADRQRLTRYLVIAGKNAMQAAAYEEARRYFTGALSNQGEDPRGRGELLLDMATTERGLGNWDQAFAYWHQAVDLYTRLGDSEATGNVFFEMFEGLLWSGREREATELVRRGWEGLKEDPSNDACMAAVSGLIHSLAGRHDFAQQAFREALSMARQLANNKLIARIQAYWSVSDFYYLQVRDALENGRASADLAQAACLPWPRAIGLSRVQVALHHLGRNEEAAAVAGELEPLARKLGQFAALSFCIWTQAWMEFAKEPDFARLEKRLAEELEINRTLRSPLLLAPNLAQLSIVEFLRGNPAMALDYTEQARRLSPFQVMLGFGPGTMFRQLAYTGKKDPALALLHESRANLPRGGAPNTIGSWAMLSCVVEGLYILGERDKAAAFYPLVRELIDTGVVCFGWIARFPQTVAGIAAAAARNWDAAQQHFDIALHQAREFPHQLEIAELRRFQAAMLIDRGQHDDPASARNLLQEALEAYTRIGMPRHSEIVGSMLSGLPAQR